MVIWTRIIVYTVLPLLFAAIHISLSKRAKAQWSEILLLYVLGSIGANGVSSFFGHFFLSDMIAEQVGWAPGSPFQLEMAFANLSVGILGFGAMGQRGGFRVATAIAVATLGFGAMTVHIMDMIAHGNFAPGNTIINVGNLLKPTLLIGLMIINHRRRSTEVTEMRMDERWRWQQVQTITFISVGLSMGYGIGFSFGYPLLLSVVGALLGLGLGYGMNRPRR